MASWHVSWVAAALLLGACSSVPPATSPTTGPPGPSTAAPAAGCPTESPVAIGGGWYAFFASVDELVLDSDLVVIGTVSEVTCDEPNGGVLDRRAMIEVERTLYGDDVTRVQSAQSRPGG